MAQLSLLLKSETRKEHSFTEQVMDAKALFSENYELQHYKQHLVHLLKAHLVIDALIEPYNSLLSKHQLEHQSRVAALKKDLYDLQEPIDLSVGISKNIQLDVPDLVGLLYVVKGSSLGGQVIGQKLQKHFERWSIPQKPHFYSLDNSNSTLQTWSTWCSTMDALPKNHEFIASTVAAAKMAFDIFCNPDNYGVFTLNKERVSSPTT
jgi:heme oxygenase